MSILHCNSCCRFRMLTLDSLTAMEGLDLAVTDDVLMRTSRTATFTLSSSSSSSSSSPSSSPSSSQSNLSHHESEIPSSTIITTTTTVTTTTTCTLLSDTYISDDQLSVYSQSCTLGSQRRRPRIQDPYQLVPNLHTLNDWMIVSWVFSLVALASACPVFPLTTFDRRNCCKPGFRHLSRRSEIIDSLYTSSDTR